ncbi:hypothetical protein [Microbacterium pumilum]|uniref:Acyl-CoA dehydrogenase/oxidase C-terminal domain-containing protein n=1 Tax=Microbacterium pumilum TaxID=344165 RepID=A0ABP5E3K8_9MICO
MTAISASRGYARTTAFERTLLCASATLDHFVSQRLERRAAAGHRRAVSAQTAFATARSDAQAHGAVGMLPR